MNDGLKESLMHELEDEESMMPEESESISHDGNSTSFEDISENFEEFLSEESTIPFSTSQKAIIKFQEEQQMYVIDAQDYGNIARKNCQSEIEEVVSVLNGWKGRRPFERKISWFRRSIWEFIVWFMLLLFIVIVFYISLAFLFNPVMVIILIWCLYYLYQFLRIREKAHYESYKMGPLKKFVNDENKKYFKGQGMELIAGEMGKWIELYYEAEDDEKMDVELPEALSPSPRNKLEDKSFGETVEVEEAKE